MIGTPGYMAPEQVRGQFEQFCPATDVFGLGGVLFYLLYGRPPCRPEGQSDVGQIIAATLAPQERGRLRHGILPRGQRPKPEVLDALESLERICLKALERDPAQRYARIEDMIIELNEWAYHKAGRKWDSDGGFW
jgi:serine/threonine protein kinase